MIVVKVILGTLYALPVLALCVWIQTKKNLKIMREAALREQKHIRRHNASNRRAKQPSVILDDDDGDVQFTHIGTNGDVPY